MPSRTVYYVRMRSEEGNRYGYVVRLASGSWDISSRSFATLFDSRDDAERFISQQTPSRQSKLSIVSARISNPIHRARDLIVFEHGNYYVTRNSKGHFEVWKMGATAAQRVSYIGYEGQKGLDRAKAEVERREREHNPIHRVRGGWQWGEHGHVYKSKAGAERQMRAIFASGYRGRNPLSRGESWFVVLMKRPDGEKLYLTASGKGEYWMQNAKLFKSEADARKAVGKILRKHPGGRESGFEVKRIV